MSKWLALARDKQNDCPPPPDNMTKPDKSPPLGSNPDAPQPKDTFCRVLSVCQVEGTEKKPAPPRLSVGGRPMTATGRIMSLDEWRRIGEGRP